MDKQRNRVSLREIDEFDVILLKSGNKMQPFLVMHSMYAPGQSRPKSLYLLPIRQLPFDTDPRTLKGGDIAYIVSGQDYKARMGLKEDRVFAILYKPVEYEVPTNIQNPEVIKTGTLDKAAAKVTIGRKFDEIFQKRDDRLDPRTRRLLSGSMVDYEKILGFHFKTAEPENIEKLPPPAPKPSQAQKPVVTAPLPPSPKADAEPRKETPKPPKTKIPKKPKALKDPSLTDLYNAGVVDLIARNILNGHNKETPMPLTDKKTYSDMVIGGKPMIIRKMSELVTLVESGRLKDVFGVTKARAETIKNDVIAHRDEYFPHMK